MIASFLMWRIKLFFNEKIAKEYQIYTRKTKFSNFFSIKKIKMTIFFKSKTLKL